jgi:hypothetical protein
VLCVLSVPAFAADDVAAEAPTLKWVLPWKADTALSYDVEDLDTQERDGKTTRYRTTSTTDVAIKEANKDGFLQTWSERNAKVELLEGDQAYHPVIEQAQASAKALEGVPLEVKLDKDGMYVGLRNADAVVTRLRTVLAPMMLLGAEMQVAKIADAKEREAARAKVKTDMQGTFDKVFTPTLIEGLVTRHIQDYAGFHGLELEADQAYELETELPNPTGGAPFPAKLQFSMSVDPDDDSDLYVSYDMTMDPEKVAAAAMDVVETLAGKKLEGKDALKTVDVVDEGLFVVDRETGIVEMFETTRTTKTEGTTKIERHRMRLVDNAHGHYWKDAEEEG